jgi:hypothetical protein
LITKTPKIPVFKKTGRSREKIKDLKEFTISKELITRDY